MQVELTRLRYELLNSPRHSNPKRLTHKGYKVFSQNDEDGILAEIFLRIGTTNKKFVEFGVGNGMECNTLWLLMQGWSGLWLQGSRSDCKAISKTHASYLTSDQLRLLHRFVTRENIDDLLREGRVDGEIDLLSIDVDGNDYWIWEAISEISPRVVAIEYNATWAPPAQLVVPYDPQRVWNGTNYFGASLSALADLGSRKGYSLVGCCLSGVNAFFVQNALLKDDVFIAPGDVDEHYEPARYFFAALASGHPPFVGPVVQPNAG